MAVNPANQSAPAASVQAAIAKAAKPSSASSGRLPAIKTDSAHISKAGHAALDAHNAALVKAQLTNVQAAALGAKLAASNPTKFKRDDINGDGRLNAAEANAAGLG